MLTVIYELLFLIGKNTLLCLIISFLSIFTVLLLIPIVSFKIIRKFSQYLSLHFPLFGRKATTEKFYLILFHLILFYFILFHFIQFHSISFHVIPFNSVLLNVIPFYFILFRFALSVFIAFYSFWNKYVEIMFTL